MIKRFCDCNGCNSKAVVTITIPRNVVNWAKDNHGNVLKKFYSLELHQTDLCDLHAQMLANNMYEIDGENNGNKA